MNKNRKIFIVAFLVFMAIVIFFLYDMSRRTIAPWEKKKAHADIKGTPSQLIIRVRNIV